MKLRTILTTTGLLSAGLSLHAQAVLQNEHADIGIAFEDGVWNLHIHDETHDVEYSPPSGPDGAILQVNVGALTTVSANPLFSFLGTAGNPIWILPNIQSPDLLFLGFGAEEIQAGMFVGDTLNMRLTGVSGPGDFTVFDYDTFGNPFVLMNTRDGLSAADNFVAVPGAHSDVNWAFSQPGIYTVNFEASGTLADGNLFTSSGPVAFTFQVVPEPSIWALMAMGLGGAWLWARRRARA
jgi:surface-anchored protein